MRLRDLRPPRSREPDLTSLINIVFLILIFFIVAGTLRPFSEPDIELVQTEPDTQGVPSPTRLVVHADGSLSYMGAVTDTAALGEQLSGLTDEDKAKPFIIVSDGRVNARELLTVADAVRRQGIKAISVLTEKKREP